jgi:predicted pore-forming effector associated with SMODS systems
MNFKYYKTHPLIAFILALFIICDYVASQIENWLSDTPIFAKINHLVHSFSTLTLIIVIFLLINHFGWKWKIFRWLIDIPNLNGRYSGELKSSFINDQNQNVVKNCVLEIKQTASYIHVYAYFGDPGTNQRTSTSYSVSEEIIMEKNGFFRLYYIFTSESDVLQVQLNNHAGTARFNYYLDNKTLDGEYYNQRNNYGTIKVKYVGNKRLGRFEK